MSMQQIIIDKITDKISIPMHSLLVNKQFSNTGRMGLVKFGEILPKTWIRFDFQHDHVTFYSDANKRIAGIYYYEDSNADAVAVINYVAEILQDNLKGQINDE